MSTLAIGLNDRYAEWSCKIRCTFDNATQKWNFSNHLIGRGMNNEQTINDRPKARISRLSGDF